MSYIDRMLDYRHLVHSQPDSAVSPAEQEANYGAAWDRPVCDCKLYSYAHPGCPGPMATRLPRGWKSGDDVPGYSVEMWHTVKEVM